MPVIAPDGKETLIRSLVQTPLRDWRTIGLRAAGGQCRMRCRWGSSSRRGCLFVANSGRRVCVGSAVRYECFIAGSPRPRWHIRRHTAGPAWPVIGCVPGKLAARPKSQAKAEHYRREGEPSGDHVNCRYTP